MKNKLTEWLVKPFLNEVDLPIKVGDDVLMGRFKNKRVKVKSITYNEKGDLQINGRPALKFRLVQNDKKLLPNKTTNKKSAEPDSDRKGVDDEYPHYKLKEDDKEPKFQSVHTKSTFNSTFGGWYTNWVPLSTKKIQSIIGKEKVSVFHVGNAEYERDVTQVARIVGKKGTLSTFTSVDKGEKLAKGKGIQSGGGIIYQIEGTLLVASTRDMQSHPDKTGRRWIDPYWLAGDTIGRKMRKEIQSGTEKLKIDENSWDKIQDKVDAEVRKETGYGDTQYDHQAHKKNVKKALGPYKRKWIKKYIDMCYKIIDKYKKQIKKHILSQKDKKSEHGWNEILVNQIKIKDVFMLTRSDLHKDEAEKIATGQVTVGSPAKFRKWYSERGGIINEMAIPSPSRAAVKKNKTDRMSGYKKVNEKKWSDKYKKSIDCNNPKGFSQKAHCDGKKKKESKDYTFGPDWIPTRLAQRKKMKKIHGKLNRSIREDVNIPVKIADTILNGRFKNKKTVVKSIDKDEHGMPTINGRKVVTFRIPVKESSQVTNAKGVKGYSSFVELGFEKEYYKHLENIFTKNGETMILKEGINDAGILKAVFLAGGPGSGKTWVAKGLFGIPERVNVSQTGMKMVNTDKELKFLLKKYGFGTDLDALPDEVFDNLTGDGPDASGLRSYAKELTGVRKKLYQNGRLGMIIDGTGDDYAKISKEKKELERKGYDCYMVFVNTTLEVALKRNKNRDRVLPEKIVVDSHREVIKNIGGFQGLFGGNNFIIIDSNKDLSPKQAQKRFNMLVKKGISNFIKRPIKNPLGKSWVRKQKKLGEKYSELIWNFGKQMLLERIDFQQVAKKIMNKYRVRSKLKFSPRATKGDYDFDRDIIHLRPFYKSVQDFMITLLHEIYHALDSKKYGKDKFVTMYTKAGQEQEDKGKDFHDNNPFEIAAERWARREWRGKWKHRLRKK